jgi:hypothetical protein
MNNDEIDKNYLSKEMYEKIEAAREELEKNPITKFEEIWTTFRVNVILAGQVRLLRFKLWLIRSIFKGH